MWPMIALGGAGLAAGVLSNAQQARQAKAQMMMRAAEQEAQPWTGVQAQTAPAFSGGNAGALIQGAVGGIQQAQGFEKAGEDKDLRQAWIELLKKQKGATLVPDEGMDLNGSSQFQMPKMGGY